MKIKTLAGFSLIKGRSYSVGLEIQDFQDFKKCSEKYGGMSSLMRKLIRDYLKKNIKNKNKTNGVGAFINKEVGVSGYKIKREDDMMTTKSFRSYTCCNIEVNEKAGTEVHCRACGEWCETKGGE